MANKTFTAGAEQVTLDPQAIGLNCGDWPAARSVLQFLAGVIPNAVVKGVIAMLIQIGNAACPGT